MPIFQVVKNEISKTRIISDTIDAAGDPTALQAGDIRVKIEAFAFTANNITYAVAGDRIGYWQFFPDTSPERPAEQAEWGVIPVWGFARVIATNHPEIEIGERLFGYFPPADYLSMTPVSVSAARLLEGAPHRAALPAVYNSYARIAGEPEYDANFDDERMLLSPLHLTAFCLWDCLSDNHWYDAAQIIILSASSKTGLGLAYALKEDPHAPAVIGITSRHHRQDVEAMGLYSRVISYDDISTLDQTSPCAIVDMSGNGGALAQLHQSFDTLMKKTLFVGMTHWQDAKPLPGMIETRSEFFFAPGHFEKRIKDWGMQGFTDKSGKFMRKAAIESRDWLTIDHHIGLEGLANIYPNILNGNMPANRGVIISMP